MTDPTPAALAKLIRDLTRQMGALLLRIEALEQRLGAPARPKTERLSREEWLARKRAAVRKATEHRWRKAKPQPQPTKRRRGKGRAR